LFWLSEVLSTPKHIITSIEMNTAKYTAQTLIYVTCEEKEMDDVYP